MNCTCGKDRSLEVVRIYIHRPAGNIGDMIMKCSTCSKHIVKVDCFVRDLMTEEQVSVFDCWVKKGQNPSTNKGIDTTTFYPSI